MSKFARWSDRPIQTPDLRHAEPIDQNLHKPCIEKRGKRAFHRFNYATYQVRTSLRYELGVWHD